MPKKTSGNPELFKKEFENAFEIKASSGLDLLDIATIGSTSSAFQRPEDYATKCKYSWSDYNADGAYGYLIDRMTHYAINGTRWHLKNLEREQKEKERDFWNSWSARVNKGMIDVLPGLDEVEKWIFKNLSITGMSAIEWTWEKININGTTYEVPVEISVHPSPDIVLKNEDKVFGKTKAYIKTVKNGEVELKRDGTNKGAFVLKLNHSPADLSVGGASFVTTVGGLNKIANTLYPEPPFFKAHEDVATRLKLRESDLDTVSKMLDQLTKVKIGDETHPPKPAVYDENGVVVSAGTIEEVKKSMSDTAGDKQGKSRLLYLPYYVDITTENPDTQALLNFDKYLASTINLFITFGIIISPGRDTRLNLTDINTQNFEQYVEFVRRLHIARFIEGVICSDIVERNKGKLTEIPSLRFNTINTKTNDFRTQIISLLKLGGTSKRIALETFNLNKDHVISDMQDEHEEGKVDGYSENELFNKSVPVAYKQQSVDPDGEETTHDRDGTDEGGRPLGSKTDETK
ncbi:MAG: hypothetical protein WC775_06330 [Patescibacteria group bacterium]|jgi:hypothetical protein